MCILSQGPLIQKLLYLGFFLTSSKHQRHCLSSHTQNFTKLYTFSLQLTVVRHFNWKGMLFDVVLPNVHIEKVIKANRFLHELRVSRG